MAVFLIALRIFPLELGAMTLQVTDFLQRVKSRRFPTIEKDMKMVLAHCGSLFLDPVSLMQASCPASALWCQNMCDALQKLPSAGPAHLKTSVGVSITVSEDAAR